MGRAQSNTDVVEIFLDESGTFQETSTDPRERRSAAGKQAAPSQLTGLAASAGLVTRDRCEEALHTAHQAAGLTYRGLSHGAELPAGEAFDRLVMALVGAIRTHNWQPVRLVNLERVSYGDRVSTYTHLVAELVLRVCERLHWAGRSRVQVSVRSAKVTLGEDPDGTLQFLASEEYWARLHEYFAFAAVRAGLATESARWTLGRVALGSARTEPELQVCDLLSNASYNEYRKCGPDAARVLRAAFGRHDLSLRIREVLVRAEDAIADGSLGRGLQVLAERLVQPDEGGAVLQPARQMFEAALDALAGMAAPARELQLTTLVSWLEQVVEWQRSTDLGARLARWLRLWVETPLRARLAAATAGEAGSLDAFAHALDVWELTARNHAGDVLGAAACSESLDRRAVHLAGRWEHGPLMVRGWIAQAVHATDRFAHAEAARRMKAVADNLGVLADLYRDTIPDPPADRVRSDLRGRALGTWLQAELFAGLTDPPRLAAARAVSDAALDEFTSAADLARQCQYRAALETAAGDFDSARAFLARSVGVADATHAAIAAAVRALTPDRYVQGFALLHWLNLLGAAARSLGTGAAAEAIGAWDASGLGDSPWCQGTEPGYPVHGVLRRLAVLHAAAGRRDPALTACKRLGSLIDTHRRPCPVLLEAILAAALAETAALLWPTHETNARKLLNHDTSGQPHSAPGLAQRLATLIPRAQTDAPALGRLLAAWPDTLARVLAGSISRDEVRAELLALGGPIGY